MHILNYNYLDVYLWSLPICDVEGEGDVVAADVDWPHINPATRVPTHKNEWKKGH